MQSAQDIVSIIQRAFSLIITSLRIRSLSRTFEIIVTVRTAHLGNASRIRPRRDSRPTSSTGPRIVSDRIFHDHHRLELVTHYPVIEPVSGQSWERNFRLG